jgi:hypothetical protein
VLEKQKPDHKAALDAGPTLLAVKRRDLAVEAVIGYMKNEGHLGRRWLKGRAGDAANVILSTSATICGSSSPG